MSIGGLLGGGGVLLPTTTKEGVHKGQLESQFPGPHLRSPAEGYKRRAIPIDRWLTYGDRLEPSIAIGEFYDQWAYEIA